VIACEVRFHCFGNVNFVNDSDRLQLD